MIIATIKRWINILVNPQKEFEKLNNKSFESVIADYMVLLVTAGILAAFASFLYALFRAIYLDIFFDISIQYIRMVNYSIGRSVSLLFLYLFAGTFLLFFASLIIKLFFKKIKYTSLLNILTYSLTPILLFSWFLPNPLPLAIWSLFLIYVGIKNYEYVYIRKDSIERRE